MIFLISKSSLEPVHFVHRDWWFHNLSPLLFQLLDQGYSWCHSMNREWIRWLIENCIQVLVQRFSWASTWLSKLHLLIAVNKWGCYMVLLTVEYFKSRTRVACSRLTSFTATDDLHNLVSHVFFLLNQWYSWCHSMRCKIERFNSQKRKLYHFLILFTNYLERLE